MLHRTAVWLHSLDLLTSAHVGISSALPPINRSFRSFLIYQLRLIPMHSIQINVNFVPFSFVN